MRYLKHTILCVCMLFLTTISSAQFSHWPTWQDNFRGSGRPSEKYWNIASQYDKRGSFEYNEHFSNIVYKQDGYLHLLIPMYQSGKCFDFPKVTTRNKKNGLYGKYSIRAKIPTGEGLIPALWLVSPSVENDYNAEIDIMEHIYTFKGKRFQSNVHLYDKRDSIERHSQHPRSYDIDMSSFHIYTLEWTPDCISFGVDGELFYTYYKTDDELWVFDRPLFLIMNLNYVQSGWGAAPNPDKKKSLPAEMLVDWVKFYKYKIK